MSAPDVGDVAQDVAAVHRRREASRRLPALDALVGAHDPLDRPLPRRLFIRVHKARRRAILTMNDPIANRPAVATMLRTLDLPLRRDRGNGGYVIDLDEVPNIDALATFEGWLVRFTKPIPDGAG